MAAREIFDVCVNQGLGIGGRWEVYLDVSHIPNETLHRKLAGVLEIYEKFVGDDPYNGPMRVFPAMHYTMGGLYIGYGSETSRKADLPDGWEQYKHMSNISGLFAGGEADYQYHGANRLGANSLLSCLWAGRVLGPEMASYLDGNSSLGECTDTDANAEIKAQDNAYSAVRKMSGSENAYRLQAELNENMTKYCTVVRENEGLKKLDGKLDELLDRWEGIGLHDVSTTSNQEIIYIRELRDRLLLSKVIARGALERNESRGAHYKPEFPERDDENWQKTTIASFDGERNPSFSYEDVDISLIKPRKRSYKAASHGGQESGGQA